MARNKGYEFESEIMKTNEQYREKGIALITKRPTPTIFRGKKLFFDEKKSTIDYEGVYQGRSIQFEAKGIGDPDKKSMPIEMIKHHQYDHLVEASLHGAVCFLIVYMACTDKIYIMTLERLKQVYRSSEEGGRKSIPISEFEENGIVVTAGRVPIDYLAALERSGMLK